MQFTQRMALPINADKVIEDIHPSPPITGFNQVPAPFRPVVYKFIQRALNVNNFNLDTVFSPEFEFIHQRPQLLAMQERLTVIEGQVADIQQIQVQMQGQITDMQAGITAIMNHLNIPVPNA